MQSAGKAARGSGADQAAKSAVQATQQAQQAAQSSAAQNATQAASSAAQSSSAGPSAAEGAKQAASSLQDTAQSTPKVPGAGVDSTKDRLSLALQRANEAPAPPSGAGSAANQAAESGGDAAGGAVQSAQDSAGAVKQSMSDALQRYNTATQRGSPLPDVDAGAGQDIGSQLAGVVACLFDDDQRPQSDELWHCAQGAKSRFTPNADSDRNLHTCRHCAVDHSRSARRSQWAGRHGEQRDVGPIEVDQGSHFRRLQCRLASGRSDIGCLQPLMSHLSRLLVQQPNCIPRRLPCLPRWSLTHAGGDAASGLGESTSGLRSAADNSLSAVQSTASELLSSASSATSGVQSGVNELLSAVQDQTAGLQASAGQTAASVYGESDGRRFTGYLQNCSRSRSSVRIIRSIIIA